MYDQFLEELGLKLKSLANNLQVSSPFDIENYFKHTELKNVNFPPSPTYLQHHYVNGVFGNVYLSAGQH